MSRKPPKKSDMGKSWMKPRRDSRQMIAPEYHLIVSEGTKTEPKYFEKVKETIDARYRDRIHLDISGIGMNTGQSSPIVRRQKTLVSITRTGRICLMPFGHIWTMQFVMLKC